jgi:hypothetical protein
MLLERWPRLPTGHNPKERVQAGTGSCYDRKSFDELLATDPVRLTDRELDRLQRALTCVESPASGVRREVFHVGHQPLAPGGVSESRSTPARGTGCRAAVLIGMDAHLKEERTVADGATVGAGAVVRRDVTAVTTVIRLPARPFAADASANCPTRRRRAVPEGGGTDVNSNLPTTPGWFDD